MKELICIVCPVGCSLAVNEEESGLIISGNKCPRGIVYAKEEILAPKRVVTATCAIKGGEHTGALRRIPVKTNVPCPRENINRLLVDIHKTSVTLPVRTGDIVINDWEGSGINVVVTRNFG